MSLLKERPVASSGDDQTLRNSAKPSSGDRPRTASVADSGGFGNTRSVTSVSTQSVPIPPQTSWDVEPVTFFTTLPPALNASPRPFTPRMPSR